MKKQDKVGCILYQNGVIYSGDTTYNAWSGITIVSGFTTGYEYYSGGTAVDFATIVSASTSYIYFKINGGPLLGATQYTTVPFLVDSATGLTTVSPTTINIGTIIGNTYQITVLDSLGYNVTNDCTYTVNNTNATVSSTGLVTANPAVTGNTLTAVVKSIYNNGSLVYTGTSTATIYAIATGITSITVSPTSITWAHGSSTTQQLIVTSAPQAYNVTAYATYSITGSGATVSTGGLVTENSSASAGGYNYVTNLSQYYSGTTVAYISDNLILT